MRWCCAAPTCESPCCSVGGEGSCGVALWVPVPSPAVHSDTSASLQLHGGFRRTSQYPRPSILVPPSHGLDAFRTSPLGAGAASPLCIPQDLVQPGGRQRCK